MIKMIILRVSSVTHHFSYRFGPFIVSMIINEYVYVHLKVIILFTNNFAIYTQQFLIIAC